MNDKIFGDAPEAIHMNEFDMLSDASLLSEEEIVTPMNNGKQVRFNLNGPLSFPESQPRDAPPEASRRLEDMCSAHVLPQLAPVPPLSASPSCSLDLSVSDEPPFFRNPDCGSISSPKINSVKSLQAQVLRLANRVQNASNSAPGAQAERQALQNLTDQFGLLSTKSSVHKGSSPVLSKSQPLSLGNIPVSVNYNLSEPIFVDLLELSVSESEIVREEKAKVAYRRRQLAVEMMKKTSKQDNLPEPCPMKFFDPHRHVFQSARLQITGIPDLVPGLRGLSRDQLNSIHVDYRHSSPTYYA